MRRCAFEGKTVDTSQGNVKRTPATIAAPSAPAGHQHQGIHHGIEMGRSKYTFLYHSARNRKFADSPLEGTGFEFRLTGFGSANFRSLSRWRASNAYQDVVIREPDRTGPSGTWQDPRSDAKGREVAFRGFRRMANRTSGEPSSQLHERHDACDFDTKTQDKLAAAN